MKKGLTIITLATLFASLILQGCRQGSTSKAEKDVAVTTSKEAPVTPSVSAAEAEERLRQSALDGDLVKVKEALDGGAGVNAVDMDGRTALMFASFNGHSEIVLELLGRGAGVDRRDSFGRTALLYAATGPFPETVTILIDKGAEVNVVDSDEHFSPLMHAAAEGHMDVVRILLKAGADPTLTDVDGDDAATFARQAGHTEVAREIRIFGL